MDVIDTLEQAWTQRTPLVSRLAVAQTATTSICDGRDVRALLHHRLSESLMMPAPNNGAALSNDVVVLDGDEHPGGLIGAGAPVDQRLLALLGREPA